MEAITYKVYKAQNLIFVTPVFKNAQEQILKEIKKDFNEKERTFINYTILTEKI